MKNPWPRLLLLCGAMLVLAGCSGSTRLAGISARLDALQVLAPAGQGETSVTATVRYVNENLLPIAASRSRHKIYLNGTLVGDIDSREPLGLPKLDSVTQDVSFNANSSALAALPSGPVNYRIESILDVEAGTQKLQTKSQHSGSVVLRR